MKLKPETLAYIRMLSPQDRKEFLAYLRDSDENLISEINHLENEMMFEKSNESKSNT